MRENKNYMLKTSDMVYKFLVVGLIVLFIGVAVAPSISGYIRKTTNIQSLKEVSISYPSKDCLLAYWKFDECSGNIAYDSSGHGYDGIIYSATWYGEYPDCGLVFDGLDDYVSVDAYSEELGLNKTDDYTIMVSFQSQSSARGTIFSMSHTDLLRAYAHFELLADGRLTFKTGDSTCLLQLNTTGTYNDGEWHDAEVRFYGEVVNPTVEIWVDGSQDATITDWLCPYLSEDFKKAKIGRRGAEDMYYFDGTIDDVKIYKYTGPSPPSPPAITGPRQVRAYKSYEWTFKAIDPDGNDLFYEILWGDGSHDDWFGPYHSGAKAIRHHTFYLYGTAKIKARAKDIHGAIGEWGTMGIEISENFQQFSSTSNQNSRLGTTEMQNNNEIFGNQPPYEPSKYYPCGWPPVDIDVNLSWDGGDPDPGDTVTYDVYFGPNPDLPLVATIGPYLWNQTQIEYDPGTLMYCVDYYMIITACDNHGIEISGPECCFTTICPNHPPDKPVIEGPSKGKPGFKYDFTFYAEDLDGDDVSYYIEWGDGTTTGWTDYFESGEPADFSHTWDKIEEFPIRCKAKDIYNAEGDWSNCSIYIPRNMVFDSNLNLLERLLERFPFLEVLLRIMSMLR